MGRGPDRGECRRMGRGYLAASFEGCASVTGVQGFRRRRSSPFEALIRVRPEVAWHATAPPFTGTGSSGPMEASPGLAVSYLRPPTARDGAAPVALAT